ncbi:Mucin-16 [Manis pentadactyla]|nr:Mucin-16 [Manis pentadactyla]
MTDVAADGVSSGDISADAELPGIGTLDGVGFSTLKLMLSVQTYPYRKPYPIQGPYTWKFSVSTDVTYATP